MNIWAIADLHLAFGVPSKTMEIFGPQWQGYSDKIEINWRSSIQPEDLVLIAGDISWAMALEEARTDLNWIDSLPGTKVMIKGNHDYWWSSLSKVKQILPPSIHLIQNNAFYWKGVAVGGARLWDTSEYQVQELFPSFTPPSVTDEDNRIYARELGRLEMSLKELKVDAPIKIAMTHYPPLGANLMPSKAHLLLEKFGVQTCVFGHLHNISPKVQAFGSLGSVSYHLTSADYLDFSPLKIASIS